MTNAIKNLPAADRLKIAHNALSKAKRIYSVEDFTPIQDGYQVEHYDQFGNWDEETIHVQILEEFIIDYYSSVSDSVLGGEHVQYEDTRTAHQYLKDNERQVIADYLNNRKS